MTHFSAKSHSRFTAGQGCKIQTRKVYLIAKVTQMAFKTGGRKCKFESLETRQMMAGDVIGRVHAGTLTLKGDNFSNGITVAPGALPNSVLVTGTTVAGNPTNVNGLPNTGITFLNVIRGFKVKMGTGNDEVAIDNLNIFGKAKIDMGTGVDTVTIDDSRFCKALDIDMGPDADHLTINSTRVDGKADIDAGRGCDDVTIIGSTFGELDVDLGLDNDTITIANTSVITETTLDGGAGINTFVNGQSNFFGGIYNKKNLAG
jgi:hypothetical protein